MLPHGDALADAEQVIWLDLKREVIVMPRDGTGANLAATLSSKLTSQNLCPNLIIRETSHDTIVNMVSVGRFITIVTKAMLGVDCPGVVFKEVYDLRGQSYLDFSMF